MYQDAAAAADAADAALQNAPSVTADPGGTNLEYYINEYGVPVIGAIVALFVAYLVSGWVGGIVRRACLKAKLDQTLSIFFGKMAKWAVMVLALLSILSIFGVQTTSFAAVFAAVGLAVGLALQGTLGNFASGVMLLIFRPFSVGDVVNVAGVTAKVVEIELFSTILDTPDNQRIIVPNGAVFGSTITNISYHDTRRVDVAVGTDYPADLDRCRQVMADAAKRVANVLDEPEPAVVLVELGDSSINWAVRVWSKTADYWAVKDALTREVKMALDAAGIGIPFPQMDLHMEWMHGGPQAPGQAATPPQG